MIPLLFQFPSLIGRLKRDSALTGGVIKESSFPSLIGRLKRGVKMKARLIKSFDFHPL